MKIRIVALTLVILASVGLLCYQGFVAGNLESKNFVRCGIVILGAVMAMLKTGRSRNSVEKKTLYKNAYPDFIREVFTLDKKLEKQFYNAVDLYTEYYRRAVAAGSDGKIIRQTIAKLNVD